MRWPNTVINERRNVWCKTCLCNCSFCWDFTRDVSLNDVNEQMWDECSGEGTSTRNIHYTSTHLHLSKDRTRKVKIASRVSRFYCLKSAVVRRIFTAWKMQLKIWGKIFNLEVNAALLRVFSHPATCWNHTRIIKILLLVCDNAFGNIRKWLC